MKTKKLTINEIDEAGKILRDGGLVAIPTETVYGLAANALNGKSVANIFKAKGRPMDNPLIVHIADMEQLNSIVSCFPEKAQKLAKNFWPGPLTIIVPKSDNVPFEVSAGLDTVAVRFPANKLAQKIILESGVPLAAPSANLSGSPSPTSACHVLNDLDGKIDAIVDGGDCEVGLESTVITVMTNPPRLLRPGGITLTQLERVLGEVDVDSAVLSELNDGEKVISPGMKYKHYSPSAEVIIINASKEKYLDFINNNSANNVAALCYDEDLEYIKSVVAISYGKEHDFRDQAKRLFSALRKLDKMENVDIVYARCPDINDMGMAVYNRLIRAAGFKVKSI